MVNEIVFNNNMIEESVIDMELIKHPNSNELMLFVLFFNKVVQVFFIKAGSTLHSQSHSNKKETGRDSILVRDHPHPKMQKAKRKLSLGHIPDISR